MKKLFKYLSLLLLLLVVGLAAVVLFNTFILKSTQIQIEALPPVKIDSQAATDRLSQAIQIQTISIGEKAETKAEEFQKFHRFLESSYPKIHTVLQKETVNNHSLLYTWRGTDSTLKPIILLAHQDVVPIDEATLPQWLHPPFSGAIADGFV